MENSNNAAVNKLSEKSPRSQIIQSYLSTIEKSLQENRPQIKLINYGTGSGKTHQLFQAVCETIEKYPNIQTIGIYVAPLREHLQIPPSVTKHYPLIPIYTINSLEMKTTDEFISAYKKWVPSILKNKNFWSMGADECSHEIVQEVRKNMSNVKNVIYRLEYLRKADFGDDDFINQETIKAVRDLNNLIEKFLEFLIKHKTREENWPYECLKMVEIFFPLHLLREKSGILMLTYDKLETLIPYFRHNGKTWVKKSSYLDKYISQHTDISRKFIVAFDEQEDGYQIMLNHKIDIISPQMLAINNALSSINREFSTLFSARSKENREFLHFVEENPRAFAEFEEYFDKGKNIGLELKRFASTYRRLTSEEGNSPNFLEQLAAINKGLDKSLQEIIGVFDDRDGDNPVILDFEMLSRVFSKFENNRSLLIPQKLYSKIGNDLMNIFSYNNLYIYNIEPLKKIFLTRPSGGHVHIVEHQVPNTASVAELIYAILAVRLQIEAIRNFLANVLGAEDSQSRSLEIWSKQIAKVQKAAAEGELQSRPIKYLNRVYVYQSYKSIINIKEISRYQHPTNNLINHPLREVSIGSTAILTSPEHKISSMLENSANVIFLISATGGISGDLSTSYDMQYLEDSLRGESGKSSFEPMIEKEIELCEEIRQYRQTKRQVTAKFFNANLGSFPNVESQEVVERFEKLILKGFADSFNNGGFWLGIYKTQELQSFIRFLFYLIEDDATQEMIAFTQTLRWIKRLLQYWESLHHAHFIIKASPEHPNIFYVQIKHKEYQSNVRVKLILYEASFNALYYEKTHQQTYLDELIEQEDEKIFFVSAYQSAAKGLNPIIKTKDGKEKDFDSLALLMDSYYTVMGPILRKSDDNGYSTTLFHFALMKSIVHLGDANLEIKDFNEYLSQPEAIAFQEQQHQILLGKGILQAIGRTERRDFPNQLVKIFINEETRGNLANLFRYLGQEEVSEIRKLSVNNHEVYLRVQEEEKKRTIQDYDGHVYNEIDAFLAFQSFRESMLKDIDALHLDGKASAVIQAWDALRDSLVFSNPSAYLEKLRESGLFPDTFIESLFCRRSARPEFTPCLASVNENGRKFQIISDSMHGGKVYPYQKRLYPEYLKLNSKGYDLEGNEIGSLNLSTNSILKLYMRLLPRPEVFDQYIPRPHFFYDVLYPSLAENFTKMWIQDVIFNGKDWKTIKSVYGYEPLLDFNNYNKLYERFDLYYIKQNSLFCIDVKAWSFASGNRLSRKTVEKTQKKLESISSEYPEFNKVNGLLLNLHAPQEKNQQHSPLLFSGNLIYFDNHLFPIESSALRDFLFQ